MAGIRYRGPMAQPPSPAAPVLKRRPNDEQKAVLNTTAKTVLINALAGTGKTTTLATKAADLVQMRGARRVLMLAYSDAGLAAIHAVGIVHRDLKPDNLMFRQDGSLALADFGVAKQVSMKITDTGDGDIVGTPYYLSPEQALGQPVDARCDIYSLGVLAFELLTGRKPYHAGSAQELLNMHVHGPVPLLPPEHAHLQAVMESMMAKDREQRYPSAATLLADLEQQGL